MDPGAAASSSSSTSYGVVTLKAAKAASSGGTTTSTSATWTAKTVTSYGGVVYPREKKTQPKQKPEVKIDNTAPAGTDGNNVNLELETTKARENRLMFELYATIFQNRMELVQAAITQSR